MPRARRPKFTIVLVLRMVRTTSTSAGLICWWDICVVRLIRTARRTMAKSDHRCVTARLVSFVDLAIVHGTADQISELTERRYCDSGALEVKANVDTEAVDVHGAHTIVHRAVNENPIWLMAGIAVLD